jgi:small neutral amino acid transporter SnatA (MarC family)
MKNTKRKTEHYSNLKMVLRIITLIIATWGLVIAYQAKNLAEWVDDKQENVIERLMFKD